MIIEKCLHLVRRNPQYLCVAVNKQHMCLVNNKPIPYIMDLTIENTKPIPYHVYDDLFFGELRGVGGKSDDLVEIINVNVIGRDSGLLATIEGKFVSLYDDFLAYYFPNISQKKLS